MDHHDNGDSALQIRFEALVEQWEDDTWMHSFPSIIMRHEAIGEIIAMGESALPLILRRYRDHGGFWHHPLRAITGYNNPDGIEPIEGVPGWVGVKVKEQRDSWLRWGVVNDLLDTAEPQPRTVHGGFELRHWGFCEDDACRDERERVYRCPSCQQTFCHQCLDLLQWEINNLNHCPKCGWSPENPAGEP